MLDVLRRALVAFLAPALAEPFSHLNERLTAVEEDLDCDQDGSLAQALSEAVVATADMRSRLDEWEPGRAADEMYGKPS